MFGNCARNRVTPCRRSRHRHNRQKGFDHRHRDIGPAGTHGRTPALHVVGERKAWHFRDEKSLGCASTAAGMRSGARFNKFQMNGPPMQKPITRNCLQPR